MIEEDRRCRLVGGPHDGQQFDRPKDWPLAYIGNDREDHDGLVAIYGRGNDGRYYYLGDDQ